MVERKTVEHVQPGALLMTRGDGVRVLLAGSIGGIVTMALFFILDRYVFGPTLCSDLNAVTGRCDSKALYASGVALVIATLPVLFYFVRLRVYRPLLVVLLSVVSLWNVTALIGSMSIVPAVLLTIILFGLTYLLFAWIVQLKNFYAALALSVVVLIALRLVLNA